MSLSFPSLAIRNDPTNYVHLKPQVNMTASAPLEVAHMSRTPYMSLTLYDVNIHHNKSLSVLQAELVRAISIRSDLIEELSSSDDARQATLEDIPNDINLVKHYIDYEYHWIDVLSKILYPPQ